MSNNNIILRGDWNVVSNYSKDTINYSKENNPNAKKALFDLINTFDLEGLYREREPRGRSYTWHAHSGLMHQSIETPAPRPSGHSGEFNILRVLKNGSFPRPRGQGIC